VLWSIRWRCDSAGNFVLGSAKPCQNCKEFALKNGIKIVYYSDNAGIIVKEELKTMDSYVTLSTKRNFKFLRDRKKETIALKKIEPIKRKRKRDKRRQVRKKYKNIKKNNI
jgi:deoxycytidylate deaminase